MSKKRHSGEKTRVLFVNPPVLVAEGFVDFPCFANLGMLHCAGAAEAAGYDLDVADAFSAGDAVKVKKQGGAFLLGCGIDEVLRGFAKKDYAAVVVCLSVFHQPFAASAETKKAFKRIKEVFPRARIIAADAYIGGMHYIDYAAEQFFERYPHADELVRYESEAVIIRCLKNEAVKKHTVHLPSKEELSAPLDSFAPPAWHLIDTEKYIAFAKEFFTKAGGGGALLEMLPLLPVSASRGCLFSCSFCFAADKPHAGMYRKLSAENIRKQLTRLKRKYGVKSVVFIDGLANGDGKRFSRILKTLDELNMKVFFANGLRADILTRAQIRRLAALAPSVSISAESASARIRNTVLNKKLKLEAVESAAGHCSEAGLPLTIHYMTGVPGEAAREVNETLAHAISMAEKHGAHPALQMYVPLSGAPLCRDSAARDYFRAFDADDGSLRMELFRRRLETAAPEKLIVNLTYRCGNSCAMCAVGGKPVEDMPLKKCVKLLSGYRAKGAALVDFDGGEPTLHDGLFAAIQSAEELGYEQISITTNGRRMSDRAYASRLLLSGITNILVSLHGADAKTHDRITGVKGSFAETMAGIGHIARLRPEGVSFGINTVLLKSNYKAIGDIAHAAVECGAEKLNVQFPTPFGRASAAQLPPMKEAIGTLRTAIDKYKKHIEINVVNLHPCAAEGFEPAALADAEKYSRHMAFVDSEPENLGTYLARKRKRIPRCEGCEYFIVCEGVYDFDRK